MKVMFLLLSVLLLGISPYKDNHILQHRMPFNLKGLFIKPYERDYLKGFGISELHRYEEIKGINRNDLIEETYDKNHGWVTLHYGGYTINFFPNGILANVRVTSPYYRFGSKKVGVGSTRKEVRRAYRFQYKNVDLRNEIGYIDGDTSNHDGINTSPWIIYKLDGEGKVREISILPYGGP